MGLVVMSKAKS